MKTPTKIEPLEFDDIRLHALARELPIDLAFRQFTLDKLNELIAAHNDSIPSEPESVTVNGQVVSTNVKQWLKDNDLVKLADGRILTKTLAAEEGLEDDWEDGDVRGCYIGAETIGAEDDWEMLQHGSKPVGLASGEALRAETTKREEDSYHIRVGGFGPIGGPFYKPNSVGVMSDIEKPAETKREGPGDQFNAIHGSGSLDITVFIDGVHYELVRKND